MDGQDAREPAAKPQRRPAARGAAKVAGSKPSKQTLQIRIDTAVKQKLEAHALGRGCTVSALVEELVRAMPTEFVLSRRAAGSSSAERPALGVLSDVG